MSNSLRDYKSNFRDNLPSGMTYDSTIARFLVNDHRFVAPWVAENYIERITRFGFVGGIPGAWDLSNASLLSGETYDAKPTTPILEDLFFKDDGTKMYLVDALNDSINEYDLSTAWDASTSTYLQRFVVATRQSNPHGVFFKPDGSKFYTVGLGSYNVDEYDLSTAWDVSTASYLQNFSVQSQELAVAALSFKTDGTKMYIVGYGGDDVNEYDLSTAWDISTASYLQNFSFAAQDTQPESFFFKPDGAKMYVGGFVNDSIFEYDLSTAWDVSTASYVQSLSVSAQGNPCGIFFKPDGSKLFLGTAGEDVFAFDVTSA